MLNIVLGIALAAAAADGGTAAMPVDAGTPAVAPTSLPPAPAPASSLPDSAPGLDIPQLEKLTGTRGWYDETEQTFRVSVPRVDVAIHVVGTRVLPQQGLTSWATFKRVGEDVLVTAEMVVTEEQVTPAIQTALDEGLEVTSLHNDFLWDYPRVMFMSLRGVGKEGDVGFAIGALFSQLHDPRRAVDRRYLRARKMPPKTKLNLRKLEAILGHKGELQRGVYRVVLAGARPVDRPELDASMGNQTWMAFAGLDAKALVNGELSVVPGKMQSTLKALVDGGLHVTALHAPQLGDGAPVVFIHFWGVGPADTLARGLRSALNQTAP